MIKQVTVRLWQFTYRTTKESESYQAVLAQTHVGNNTYETCLFRLRVPSEPWCVPLAFQHQNGSLI